MTQEKRRKGESLQKFFHRFANRVSAVVGSASAFAVAVAIIIIWAITGPIFHFSDTWQLIINTGTTIITFLMVFLIQHAQNHDARAIQLKLDELIRAMKGARNTLIDLEDMSDEELDTIQKEFALLTDRVAQKKNEKARHRAAAPGTKGK